MFPPHAVFFLLLLLLCSRSLTNSIQSWAQTAPGLPSFYTPSASSRCRRRRWRLGGIPSASHGTRSRGPRGAAARLPTLATGEDKHQRKDEPRRTRREGQHLKCPALSKRWKGRKRDGRGRVFGLTVVSHELGGDIKEQQIMSRRI